jgi:hypothetical protein
MNVHQFLSTFKPSSFLFLENIYILVKKQANETQLTQFKTMQLIHCSGIYFMSHMSANSSCVILPLFPTNKISIYLTKFCTAACNPDTV